LPEIEKLFIKYASGIHHLLLKLTKSEDTADDLVQEVFMQLIKYYKPNVKNERAYIYSIAYNIFKRYYKKTKEGKVVFSDMAGTIADKKNHYEDIDWQHIREAIIKKLEDENKTYAPLFILRIDAELTYEELSIICGISKRTVLRYFENIRKLIIDNFKEDISGLKNWRNK